MVRDPVVKVMVLLSKREGKGKGKGSGIGFCDGRGSSFRDDSSGLWIWDRRRIEVQDLEEGAYSHCKYVLCIEIRNSKFKFIVSA